MNTQAYFGILSCPNCIQKVSLEPEDIKKLDKGLGYRCKRCGHEEVFADDFVFKSPNGRNMTPEEVLTKPPKKNEGSWFRKLFS